MLAFIPSGAREASERLGEFLLRIDAESILQPGPHRMIVDLRGRSFSLLEKIDRLMVVAHVGEIGEGEQPNRSVAVFDQARTKLEFVVLRMRVLQIFLESQPVGPLGYERFRKPKTPCSIFVVDNRAPRVAARVGGVVVGAVVYDCPVHELRMTIVGDAVDVEEIHQVEFADVDIEPARRQGRENRERCVLDLDRVVAQRDHFAIPEPRQVRLRAQAGVANRIDVGETSESERLAKAAAAGAFEISDGFERRRQLETHVERGDFGRRLFGRVIEAVGAAVLCVKARMPLENVVALRGEPPRERVRMRKDGIVASDVVDLSEGGRRGKNRAEQNGGGRRKYPDQRAHADLSYRIGSV